MTGDQARADRKARLDALTEDDTTYLISYLEAAAPDVVDDALDALAVHRARQGLAAHVQDQADAEQDAADHADVGEGGLR